jgi:hypothetical protein
MPPHRLPGLTFSAARRAGAGQRCAAAVLGRHLGQLAPHRRRPEHRILPDASRQPSAARAAATAAAAAAARRWPVGTTGSKLRKVSETPCSCPHDRCRLSPLPFFTAHLSEREANDLCVNHSLPCPSLAQLASRHEPRHAPRDGACWEKPHECMKSIESIS